MNDTQQIETRRRIKVCIEALVKELKSRGVNVIRDDENTLTINGMTFTATDQLSDTYNDVCYLLTDYDQIIECTLSRISECADTIEELLDVQVEKMKVMYRKSTEDGGEYTEETIELPDEVRLNVHDGDMPFELVLRARPSGSEVWYDMPSSPMILRNGVKLTVNAYTNMKYTRLKYNVFADSENYGSSHYEGYVDIGNYREIEEAIDHVINDVGIPRGGFYDSDVGYDAYSDFKYDKENEVFYDMLNASSKKSFSQMVNEKRDKNRGIVKNFDGDIRDYVKVGDIYYTSWGYDMTIVDFYEITSIIGKQTVTMRKLNQKRDEHMSGIGTTMPVLGSYNGDDFRARAVNSYWNEKPVAFNVEYHQTAYKWDGNPLRFNDWD